MNILNPINLNDRWHYFFADTANINFKTVQDDPARWIPLEKLSDWLITSSVQFGTDWFWRTIELPLAGDLTKYVLQIDKVPDNVQVYINGRSIGGAEAKRIFSRDITAFVKSGVNHIIFKLTCSSCISSGGRFGNVSLSSVSKDQVARVH